MSNKGRANKGKDRSKPGGGFLPGSEEIFTISKTRKLMKQLLKFLEENDDICFMGELLAKAEWKKIEDSNTIHYLLYKKYKNSDDIQIFLSKINRILEFRCAKTREMYPGIAAMALKNKHQWKDKYVLDDNKGEYKFDKFADLTDEELDKMYNDL